MIIIIISIMVTMTILFYISIIIMIIHIFIPIIITIVSIITITMISPTTTSITPNTIVISIITTHHWYVIIISVILFRIWPMNTAKHGVVEPNHFSSRSSRSIGERIKNRMKEKYTEMCWGLRHRVAGYPPARALKLEWFPAWRPSASMTETTRSNQHWGFSFAAIEASTLSPAESHQPQAANGSGPSCRTFPLNDRDCFRLFLHAASSHTWVSHPKLVPTPGYYLFALRPCMVGRATFTAGDGKIASVLLHSPRGVSHENGSVTSRTACSFTGFGEQYFIKVGRRLYLIDHQLLNYIINSICIEHSSRL